MAIIYLTSDLHGDDSFSGQLTLAPLSLAGSFQGNGLMTGSGNIILEPLEGAGSFQGNATFIGAGEGTFDPTPITGEGVFQGNGLFIGAGTVLNPDPLALSGDFFGIAYFSGAGELVGSPPEPSISAFMSANLEGDDDWIMNGVVSGPIVEPPPSTTPLPCEVEYDTETCSCVTT